MWSNSPLHTLHFTCTSTRFTPMYLYTLYFFTSSLGLRRWVRCTLYRSAHPRTTSFTPYHRRELAGWFYAQPKGTAGYRKETSGVYSRCKGSECCLCSLFPVHLLSHSLSFTLWIRKKQKVNEITRASFLHLRCTSSFTPWHLYTVGVSGVPGCIA